VQYASVVQENINMDIKEIGWESVDWIDFVQDRDIMRPVVNEVMNIPVP